jgi:lysozyme
VEVNAAGVELIKEFEGFRSAPYQDSVGVWTIGYGHTAGVGPHSPDLTEAQAEKLLREDLDREYAPKVNALGLPLNQNQFDALVSFVYNLGPLYLEAGHTMGDALRAHNWTAAADSFTMYDEAGGHALPGLLRRREAEKALFLKPV